MKKPVSLHPKLYRFSKHNECCRKIYQLEVPLRKAGQREIGRVPLILHAMLSACMFPLTWIFSITRFIHRHQFREGWEIQVAYSICLCILSQSSGYFMEGKQTYRKAGQTSPVTGDAYLCLPFLECRVMRLEAQWYLVIVWGTELYSAEF